MYAIVRDTPLSWEHYRLLASELGNDAPEGLLIRVAGRTVEGVRVIELWKSREALQRYERELLRPAQQLVPAPLGSEAVRELVVEHVLRPRSERTGSGGDRGTTTRRNHA